MPQSAISLNARLAKPSDAPLIARLCRRAVGPGDYVLRILSDVIADKGLFLAWSGRELVGMTNLNRSIDGSGWLSMGRTDPKWRRKGVALNLQHSLVDYAQRDGIRTLRLWTLATNTPSINACMKGGFRPVCQAAHVSCMIRAQGKPKRFRQMNLETKKSPKSLLRSPYLKKTNGYLAYKWHFVKATEKLLEEVSSRGELFWHEKSAFILTNPEISFGTPHSSLTLLQGSPAASLRKIKETARRFGRVWLGSYLPYNSYILSVSRREGFKRDSWGNHCIVFEKKI